MKLEKIMFYPLCFLCKHYVTEIESCKAYPDGIPRDILKESIYYDEGHKCAEGVQYELMERWKK